MLLGLYDHAREMWLEGVKDWYEPPNITRRGPMPDPKGSTAVNGGLGRARWTLFHDDGPWPDAKWVTVSFIFPPED